MSHSIPRHYYITNTLPAVILSAMGMTYFVFIPKVYADEIGINLTVLGILLFISRIWDALIDPLIGLLSDQTNSKWGRRKPWIAGGSIFVCIFFYILLNPYESLSQTEMALWFAVGSFFFFIFWTAVTVPYEALGVEITYDYHHRTRLLGLRESGIVAGTFIASLLPYVAAEMYGNTVKLSNILSSLSLWYCGLLLLSSGLAVVTLQPKNSLPPQEYHHANWRLILNNKPFRLLLIAFSFTSFGQYLSASLILFYTSHVLGSANGSKYLALYIAIAFVSIPVWLYAVRWMEKKQVWILSMILTVIPFLCVLTLGNGDESFYAILISFSAVCSGGMLTLPASMQADVIDFDEYHTGLRREGLFTGLWALFRKLSAAAGAGLAFPILDWYGYTISGVQSATALSALSILYAGIPCLCYLTACVLIWFYPLNREFHQTIRQQIDKRYAETKGASA